MVEQHVFSKDKALWQPAPDTQATESAETLLIQEKDSRPVRGFGVAFSELSYEAFALAGEAEGDRVMSELFDEDKCGFTLGRIPIGANDFALNWYSCDEIDGDWSLSHFSIQRDKERLIPLIRRAQTHSPALTFFASPWSPPTWLKTKKVYNFGRLRSDAQTQKTYADYLVRFLSEYRKEGIPIAMLHVQNEPSADQKFPSCQWSGPAMREFIRDYLGPALEMSGEKTELWLGTINSPYVNYRSDTPYEFFYDAFTNTVLSDPGARRFITGVGVQWGGKHQLDQIEAAYPEMRIMQTESECGDGSNSWEQVEYLFHTLWHYFRHGTESYVYWNLCLEKDAASTWGWKQNSLTCFDQDTHGIVFNPEFYFMKHFSHFVRPGARLCAVHGHFAANSLVFHNVDGSYAAVLMNGLNEAKTLRLLLPEGEETVTIQPHALHSLRIWTKCERNQAGVSR